MKTYISALLFCSYLASANIIIKSKEANEVIQSRQKRASQGWSLSDVEQECFEKTVCRNFEEFQEGAENVYGKSLIRKDRRSKQAYKNLYNRCHSADQFCSNRGNECECNVQFTNWLKNPELPTDTTEAPITAKLTTAEPTYVEETTTEVAECTGWFCFSLEDDDTTEDPIK